jgi:hypothetical protein
MMRDGGDRLPVLQGNYVVPWITYCRGHPQNLLEFCLPAANDRALAGRCQRPAQQGVLGTYISAFVNGYRRVV